MEKLKEETTIILEKIERCPRCSCNSLESNKRHIRCRKCGLIINVTSKLNERTIWLGFASIYASIFAIAWIVSIFF